MRQAVKDGDLPRALGAAFDARLDAEIDLRSVLSAIDPIEAAGEAPLGIDGLLERANLHELLAARVELASEFLAGRERARARVALGRLYAGPLASTRSRGGGVDRRAGRRSRDASRPTMRCTGTAS